jgi:hypothetical protein
LAAAATEIDDRAAAGDRLREQLQYGRRCAFPMKAETFDVDVR